MAGCGPSFVQDGARCQRRACIANCPGVGQKWWIAFQPQSALNKYTMQRESGCDTVEPVGRNDTERSHADCGSTWRSQGRESQRTAEGTGLGEDAGRGVEALGQALHAAASVAIPGPELVGDVPCASLSHKVWCLSSVLVERFRRYTRREQAVALWRSGWRRLFAREIRRPRGVSGYVAARCFRAVCRSDDFARSRRGGAA